MRPIDYFDRAAARVPDSTFVYDAAERYDFRQARDRTESIARALYREGFVRGDSVAVYAPNSAAAVLCIFAAHRAGGAWVPVNVRNTAAANGAYMAYARTRWLFFHSAVSDQVREVIPLLPELKSAVCIDRPEAGCPALEEFCADPGGAIPDWSDPFGAPQVIFSRWPTGGTTGPSKGVEIDNRVATTMIELGLKYYVGDHTDDIVHLAVAPITHAAGIIVSVFAAVGGATVVLPGFDAATVLATIERERVSHVFLPPTAFYALLDEAARRPRDTASLRQVLIAAAPVSAAKLKQGVEVFGPCICQCFGQAEAPMLISFLGPDEVAAAAAGERPERLASCGQATSATDVAILDDAGQRQPPGERGEICCRGPLVTPGYFERPEATAEARRHGWHHTGDIGYLDDDGYLYIVDRKKDMIITGGFNVFATEVEGPIMAQPEVLECAVVGVPDDKWGEAIKAIVVLRAGAALDEAELLDRCRASLGGLKCPKSIEFWDAIPKTPVGKTDKKAIRARYWAEGGRAVH